MKVLNKFVPIKFTHPAAPEGLLKMVRYCCKHKKIVVPDVHVQSTD